jgi:hypothetical protein
MAASVQRRGYSTIMRAEFRLAEPSSLNVETADHAYELCANIGGTVSEGLAPTQATSRSKSWIDLSSQGVHLLTK